MSESLRCSEQVRKNYGTVIESASRANRVFSGPCDSLMNVCIHEAGSNCNSQVTGLFICDHCSLMIDD